MKKLRNRQLYPPQNFRRKLLNYLGVNNRGKVSRPSPGQFTISALRPRVGLHRQMPADFLSRRVRYFVLKGRNGASAKHFVESDFTPELVAALNAEYRGVPACVARQRSQ